MPRTKLTRYARWQLRDYVVERGILSFIIAVVLISPVLFAVHGMHQTGASPMDIRTKTANLAAGVADSLGLLLVLLAIQRSVAGDRTSSYYLFYFSKPVRPWLFYLQRYVLFGLGLLLVFVLLLVVARIAGAPIDMLGAMSYFAIIYVSMGGIGFLCSAVTRYDWATVAVVWYGALLVRTFYAHASGWRFWVASILPPTDIAGQMRGALFQGHFPPASSVIWLTGYGVACLVLGLLVIQRRPLGS
jgi:hypothetical protein